MAFVIGHRGAKALAPENTLRGIRSAASSNADWVEIDVRLSKDGTLILMHDETVDRTTNGSGRVENLSLGDLKSLNVDGDEIPTLSQAIKLTKELGLRIVVEMKEEGLEEMVAEELKGQKAMVTSFYHGSLREIKNLSDLETGIIIASLPIKPIELALWAGADSIFPKRTNPELFKMARKKGIQIYPWTINDKDEAEWLLRLGADGLVTDNPQLIREIIDKPIRDTTRGNCEYYPCHHFQGQDCTNCFCPFYPCRDRDLGRFVRTKRGKRVWTCIDCRLVHKPRVVEYLAKNPDATIGDLKILYGTD